jgi:predicted thioesterase
MNELKPGIKGSHSERVTPEKTARHYGSGSVEVFATPAMIAGMERTCMDSVQPMLGDGETTVGIMIHATHLKATPLNDTITYQSVLTSVDDRQLTFTVEAYDAKALIGRAEHHRFIINAERFMQKLDQ